MSLAQNSAFKPCGQVLFIPRETFDDFADYPEMDEGTFRLCENLMSELEIDWCGWIETPTFTLCAEEAQVLELEERLKKPIARWRVDNGF